MLLLIVTLTITELDARKRECSVACRAIGYDESVYVQEKGCGCLDWKEYEELINRKRIVLPKLKAKKIQIYE